MATGITIINDEYQSLVAHKRFLLALLTELFRRDPDGKALYDAMMELGFSVSLDTDGNVTAIYLKDAGGVVSHPI